MWYNIHKSNGCIKSIQVVRVFLDKYYILGYFQGNDYLINTINTCLNHPFWFRILIFALWLFDKYQLVLPPYLFLILKLNILIFIHYYFIILFNFVPSIITLVWKGLYNKTIKFMFYDGYLKSNLVLLYFNSAISIQTK